VRNGRALTAVVALPVVPVACALTLKLRSRFLCGQKVSCSYPRVIVATLLQDS
jgi:hypothetical protein